MLRILCFQNPSPGSAGRFFGAGLQIKGMVLRTPCFQNLGPGIDSRVLFVPRSPCISDRSAGPGGTQIIQQWHFASWVERVLHDLSADPVRPCSSVLCLLDGTDAIFFDGAASGGRVLLDTRIAKSSI